MILEIVKCGHPVLREKGQRIDHVTAEIRQLAADMIETMYAAAGVGLAAQQIGRPLLLTVIDVANAEQPGEFLINDQPQPLAAHMPLVLVNPHLSHPRGEQLSSEGCLSIPEVTADIARAAQHEIDHLNGILFLDRMDAATRASFAGKIKKLQKETQAKLATAGKPRRLLARL